MDLELLSKPLSVHQIDFRVMTCSQYGHCNMLAYKDARCDMQRLDEACGPLAWKREHSRDNHNCTVSIWCHEAGHWVGKEDTGTESNAEAQKGLASDSFKRACFNWGIGRELYDYPKIMIKIDPGTEMKGTKPIFGLFDNFEWASQFTDGVLSYLACRDGNKKVRYQWGTRRAD